LSSVTRRVLSPASGVSTPADVHQSGAVAFAQCRLRHRRTDCGKVRQARGEKHICARSFEGLQAADGVVQTRSGVEEIVRPRGQDKGKPEAHVPPARQQQSVRQPSEYRKGDCPGCQCHLRSCIPRVPPRPPAGPFPPRLPACPNPFSRSAETGKSVASTIKRACASA
jgi:hypothetical protein